METNDIKDVTVYLRKDNGDVLLEKLAKVYSPDFDLSNAPYISSITRRKHPIRKNWDAQPWSARERESEIVSKNNTIIGDLVDMFIGEHSIKDNYIYANLSIIVTLSYNMREWDTGPQKELSYELLTTDPDEGMPYDELVAKLNEIIPMACPKEGGFVGWKVALIHNDYGYRYQINPNKFAVVKLYVPASAKRSSALGSKCRVSEAVVLDILEVSLDKSNSTLVTPRMGGVVTVKPIDGGVCSIYNNSFDYCKGVTVRPYSGFEENRFIECASGIHCYMDIKSALQYIYANNGHIRRMFSKGVRYSFADVVNTFGMFSEPDYVTMYDSTLDKRIAVNAFDAFDILAKGIEVIDRANTLKISEEDIINTNI